MSIEDNLKEEKIDIRSMEYEELEKWIEGCNLPRFRAGQLYSWMHQKCISSFDEMSDIPTSFREKLKKECTMNVPKIRKRLISKIDGTRKYLFELEDGIVIESVLMRYKFGNSVCVSSQAGCAMGCSFCASTVKGLQRNLYTSEILGQIYEIQKDINERVSNVVIMGMGEPLANYDNVMSFIRILSDEKTLHISQRNITMSTCGLVPAIRRLSKESLKITLALSLHAPDDDIRRRLMPIAKRYSIDDTLAACNEFFKETGRRVTIEYCMVGGINDRPEHAEMLAKRLKGLHTHVNLIPVNPTRENGYDEVDERSVTVFKGVLERHGIAVTRRREMGRDINGACGQLRLKDMQESTGSIPGGNI